IPQRTIRWRLTSAMVASSESRGLIRRMWAPRGTGSPWVVGVGEGVVALWVGGQLGSSRSGARASGAPDRQRPTILAANDFANWAVATRPLVPGRCGRLVRQ